MEEELHRAGAPPFVVWWRKAQSHVTLLGCPKLEEAPSPSLLHESRPSLPFTFKNKYHRVKHLVSFPAAAPWYSP